MTPRLWPRSATHTCGIAGLVLAAGLAFAFAFDVQARADVCRYAREHGEIVTADVTGRSVDPDSSEGVLGPGQVIEDSCFVQVRFSTRNGFAYQGRTRVSRQTWERAEDARPSHPYPMDVCVPPAAPDHWVLHRDALGRERAYRAHRNYAVLTGGVIMLLALLGVTGAPLINRVNKFLTRNIPPAYSSKRRRQA